MTTVNMASTEQKNELDNRFLDLSIQKHRLKSLTKLLKKLDKKREKITTQKEEIASGNLLKELENI